MNAQQSLDFIQTRLPEHINMKGSYTGLYEFSLQLNIQIEIWGKDEIGNEQHIRNMNHSYCRTINLKYFNEFPDYLIDEIIYHFELHAKEYGVIIKPRIKKTLLTTSNKL